MPALPRISVITPSYNQGRFLGRTIDSVLAQDYPNLEHIVVDGMSSDETVQVLARYPHLRVLREPDRGQADAINKGFALATGDIFCFLNSDDTFLPGALHRVAAEIDPGRGRHVVMGRCAYIDQDDRPNGVEHPSAYLGHRRLLEVWKVHTIPQPATFWTAEAWRRCGPLDAGERLALDYDLMCRFSRHYPFHFIDQVLATYRLHADSKSCANSATDIYEHAIRVSRRYWGPPTRLQYWQLRLSLAEFRLEQKRQRRQRAAQLAAEGYHARRVGARKRALACHGRSVLLAPEVALRRLLFARPYPTPPEGAESHGGSAWGGVLPAAWREYRGAYPDGYVGPLFVTTIRVKPGQRTLRLKGGGVVDGLGVPIDLELSVEGRLLGRHRVGRHEPFAVAVPLEGVGPGDHELTIRSGSFIVLHDYLGCDDYRPLSFRLKRLLLNADSPECRHSGQPDRPLSAAS